MKALFFICISFLISRISVGGGLDCRITLKRVSESADLVTDTGLRFIHLHFSNLLPNVLPTKPINAIQLTCTCHRLVALDCFLLIKAFEVLAWLFIYQLGGNENYLRAVEGAS